jgi:hypothetical protein
VAVLVLVAVVVAVIVGRVVVAVAVVECGFDVVVWLVNPQAKEARAHATSTTQWN